MTSLQKITMCDDGAIYVVLTGYKIEGLFVIRSEVVLLGPRKQAIQD